MTNNLQNPDLPKSNSGEGILGEGAEKYLRDTANIEDLPGDDDDLEIDDDDQDDDDDIASVDYDEGVDDVDAGAADDNAAVDAEEDEDYINKDEAKRDLRERGLRS